MFHLAGTVLNNTQLSKYIYSYLNTTKNIIICGKNYVWNRQYRVKLIQQIIQLL